MRLGSVARVSWVPNRFILSSKDCFFFFAYGDALLVVGCTSPALDCGFGRSVELCIAVNYCAELVELLGAMDAVSVLRVVWSSGWR